MAHVHVAQGIKTQAQFYNAPTSIIHGLSNDLFYTHIFLCMCVRASPKDENILCHCCR